MSGAGMGGMGGQPNPMQFMTGMPMNMQGFG
jgi:hypothetical protein